MTDIIRHIMSAPCEKDKQYRISGAVQFIEKGFEQFDRENVRINYEIYLKSKTSKEVLFSASVNDRWKYFDFYITASSDGKILIYDSSKIPKGHYLEFDNVRVVEWPGLAEQKEKC